MMPETDYTAVATTFNDEKGIVKYLDSVMSLSTLPVELIIADGGSKDNTVQVIEDYAKTAPTKITVYSGQRLNIAEGYNFAIKKSSTELILITGIGNLYDSSFARALLNRMQESGADIAHGVIQGQDNGFFSRIYNAAYLRGKKGKIPVLPSNRGVLIKKSVFERIGYFYENFVYAGEDTELFLFAYNAGIKIVGVDDAILYWDTPHSFKEDLKKTRAYALSKWQFMDNGKTMRSQIMKMLFPIVALIILLVFITNPIVWVLYALGYCLFAYRIKSFNPLVVGLRFIDDFMDSYYYFSTREYGDAKYKVTERKILDL